MKQTRLSLNTMVPEIGQLPITDMPISNDFSHKSRFSVPQRYASLQYRNVYKEQSNYQNRSIFSFGMRRIGERKTDQSPASQSSCMARPSKLCIRPRFNNSRPSKQLSPLSEGHPTPSGVTFEDSANWSVNDLLKQEVSPAKKVQRLLRSEPDRTSFSARESPENSMVRLLDPECSSLDCGNPRYTTPEKFCTICRSDKTQAEDLPVPTVPRVLSQQSERKSSQDDWSGRCNGERRVSFALDQNKSLETTRNSDSPTRSGFCLGQLHGSGSKAISYNFPKRMEKMLENLKRTGLTGRLSPVSQTNEKKFEENTAPNEDNMEKLRSRFRPEEFECWRGQKQHVGSINPNDSTPKTGLPEGLTIETIGNGLPGQDGEYVTKAVNLDIANKATTEILSKTGDQNIQEVKVQTETKEKVSPVYFLHFLPRGPLFNRKQGGTDNKKSSKTQKKKLIPEITPNQPPNSEAVANETGKSRSSQTDPTKWCNGEQVRDIASPNSNTIEQHVADDAERFSTPPSTETLNSILEGTVTLAKQAVIQPVVQDHKKQTTDNAQMIFRPSISGPESSQLVRKSRERKHHHHKHPRESACSVSSKRSRRDHNDDVTCATATVPLDSIALEDWINDLTENKANQSRLQKVFRLAKDVHELTKDDPHWKQFLYDQPRTNMDRDIDRVVDKLRRNALQLIELEQAFRMSKVQELERKRKSSHSKRRESLVCQRSLRRSHAQERVTQASSLLVKSPIEQGLLEDTLYEKVSGGTVQTDQSLDYFPENLKSTAKSDFKAEQDTESRQCDEGELSPMHTRKQDTEEITKQRESVERENSPMPTSKIEQENISKPRKSTERDHPLMYTWNEEQKEESKPRKSVERGHVAMSTNIAEKEDVSQSGKSVERGHSPLQAWTEEQQEESSKPRKSVEREHLPMQTLNKEQKDESKPRKSVTREHLLAPAFPVEQGEVSRARKSVERSPIPKLNDEKQEGLKSRSPVKPGSFPVPIFDAKQRQDSNPIKSTEEMRSPTPAVTAEQRGDSKHVAGPRSPKTSDAHSVAVLVEDKLLSSKFSPRVLTPEKTSLHEDTKEINGIHSDVRNTELLEKTSTKIALKDNGNKVHVDSVNAGADPTNLMGRASATPTGKPNRRLSSCASMQGRSVAEAKLDTTSGKQSTYSGLAGQTELPWDKLSLPDMKHSANIYDLEQSPTCMKCESRPALLIAEAKSLPCSVNKNLQCGCGSSEPGPHVHEILPDQYCPTEKKAPMLNEPTTILPVKSSDGFRNDSSTNLAEQCIIPKEVPVDDVEFVSNKSPRKKNLTSITQKDKPSSVNQTVMNKSSGYLSPLSSREAKNPTTENRNQQISTKRSEHTIDELQRKPTSLRQKDDFVNIISEFLEIHTKDARNRTSTAMTPVAAKVDEDNKTLDELPIRPSKADNVLNTPGVISNLSESSSPRQPNQRDIHDETPVANVQSDYRILVQPQTEGSEALSAMEISPLQHELASIIKSGKYCEKDSDASPSRSLSHKTWKRGRNMPPECICAEGLSLPSTADNVFVASRSPSKSSVSLVGDKTSKLAESREMDSKQNVYSITRCESLEVHRGSTSQTDLDAEMRSGPHSLNSELSPKTKNSPVTTSPGKINRDLPRNMNTNEVPYIPEETLTSMPVKTETDSPKTKSQSVEQNPEPLYPLELKAQIPAALSPDSAQTFEEKTSNVRERMLPSDPNGISGLTEDGKINSEALGQCENVDPKMVTEQWRLSKTSKDAVKSDRSQRPTSNLANVPIYADIVNEEQSHFSDAGEQNELFDPFNYIGKQLDQDIRKLSSSPQTSTWTGTVTSEFISPSTGSASKTKNERQRGIQSLPKIPEVQQEENREEDDDDEAKQSEAGTQRTSEREKENPTATLTIQFCLLGPNDAPNGSRHHELHGEECGKSEPVNSLSYKLAVVPLNTELNKDLQREQFPISTLVHKYNEQREGKIDRPPSLVFLNENLRPEFQNQADSLADHSTAMKIEANHPSGISSFSGSRGSYPLPTSHSQNPTEDEICCPYLFSLPSDSYQLSGKMVNIPGEMFSTRSSVPTSEQSRVSASASDKLRNTARAKPVTNAHQTPSLSSDPFQVTQSDYIEKENNMSTERPHNTDTGPVALSGTFDNDRKISDNIGSSLSEGQKDAIRTLRNSLDYVKSSQHAQKYFTSEENNLKQVPSTVNSGPRTTLNKTNMERPIDHGEITNQVDRNSKRGSDHPTNLTNKQSVKSDNILLTRGESVPQNHERSRDYARSVLSNGSENPRVSVQQRKFSLPTIKEPHGLGKARTSDANSTDWKQSAATSHRKCLQLASSQNSPECYHSEKPQSTSGIDRVSIRTDSRQNSLPLIENQITDTSRTSLVQQRHSKSRQSGDKMHSEPDVHTSQLNGLIENESKTMPTSLPIVAEQPRASGSGSTIIISHSPLYSEDPSTRFDEVQRHSSKRSRRDGANQPIEPSTFTTPRASSGGADGGAKGSRKSRKYRSSAKKSTILTVMVGERVNSELSVRESSPDEGSLPSTSSTTMLRSLAQHTPHERGLDSRLDGELLDCDQITDLRMHLQPEPIFQPARPVSISSRLSGTKQQTNPLKITVPGLNRLRDRPAGDLIEPSDTASLHKIVGNTEKPSRLLSISKISMSKHESEYTLEAENINFNPGTQSSDIKRIEVDLDSQANPTILIEQTRSTANEKHSIHQTEITTQFGRKYIANHSAQTFEDIEASKSRRSIQNQLGSSKPRSRNAKAQVVLSNGTSAELMLQYMASGMTKQMNRPLSPHETASVNQKKNSINWLGGLNQGILRKPVYSSQSEETQSGAQLGSPESFTSSCEASPSYSSSSQPRHETRICPEESPGDKSEEISVSICISDDCHSGFSRTTSSSRRDSSDSLSLDRRICRTVRNFKRNVACDNKAKHALCRRLQSNQLCHHAHSHHRHHQRKTKHRRSHSRSIRPISVDSYCSGCTESNDSREVNSGENGRVIDLVSSTRPSRRCRSQCVVSPDFEKAFKLAPNVLRLFRLSSSLKDLSVHLIYRELRSMLLQRLLGKHEEEMDELSELVCRSHYV
ncbi:hypothetical protein FGIG_04330 [Fasciola gigantica]|uniref:Uncharacterized protein n=1 Tax=Fasciola gigantica TaxID=46835 RepID=A0A504YQB4_FASGI|nr:hypothetical protein FGIG_04330 [Fasciola gigantica]